MEMSHSARENLRRLNWQVYNVVKNALGPDQYPHIGIC
jgi:hypothetical protein